ncbi:MAG: response regulator transcription factor [Bacteroidales bacterium]|nr:response regulator transcription factor [Bacteroidales bacterium]
MENKAKILLVEDDYNFGSVLKAYLELHDYEVEWIADGKFAIKSFNENRFDLCVLDIMLPNMNGFEIAGNIHKLRPKTPFIFLTAKTLKEDVLRGYETGADDYITKPFDSEVLLAKVKAVLQRTLPQANSVPLEEIYTFGEFVFNYLNRTLVHNNKTFNLSPREADLLKLLCEHKNEVLPRNLALQSIWGEEGYFTTRSMDVYITKLRKYLKNDPKISILNIHGNGFRLTEQ